MDVELTTQGSSDTQVDDTQQHQQQPMTVQHTTGWVDHAVLSIATACNLCDVYVHEQVRFEWDTEEKDRRLDQASFDEIDKNLQIEFYKKFLFDESSIRIDDDCQLEDGSPAPPQNS